MYVNIFRKGSVGLFQKHFASISVSSSRKNCVSWFKFSKKQVRIKALENRDEAKRKARNYFNFFIRTLLKEKKKTSGKTTTQERLGETKVEK